MKLSELDGLVSAAQSAEEEQNKYVLSLGAKITAGEKIFGFTPMMFGLQLI